jgi:hypothetical protein
MADFCPWSSRSCKSGLQVRACGKKRRWPASVARKEPRSRSVVDAPALEDMFHDEFAHESSTSCLLTSSLELPGGDTVSSSCSNFRTRLARSSLFEEETSNERVSVYGEGGSWTVGRGGECG